MTPRCAGLSGGGDPLCRSRVRRRAGGVGRRLEVASLHAALGTGHDGGARLGGGGAGDVRSLAAVLAADWRVVLRRADVSLAVCAGAGRGSALGAAVGAAVYRHRGGAGVDLARRAADPAEPAGDAGAAV